MRPLMLLSAFVFDFSKWALRRKILKMFAIQSFMEKFCSLHSDATVWSNKYF